MQRHIGLLSSHDKSPWVSCQTITENLVEAYKLLPHQLSFLEFNSNQDDIDLWKLAREIHQAKLDQISFVSHKPHPYKLIKILDQISEGHLPEMVFHVFGDFPLDAALWLKLQPILQKTKVKFLCASDKEVNFVRQFIAGGEVIVDKLPFPVNSEFFKFDPALRSSVRIKNELSDEVVFLYTGRLSRQKNIIPLVTIFSQFVTNTKTNAKLYLAGTFDDIAYPYLGDYRFDGDHFAEYLNLIERLPKNISERIIFLGDLNQHQLKDAYHMADYFISLSVHNDEDFGMSPAEAGVSGLPLLLTDWGGYSSFKIGDQNFCHLIPLMPTEWANEVTPQVVYKIFFQASLQRPSDEKRLLISQAYCEYLSVRSNAKILEAHLQAIPQFTRYLENMDKVASAFSVQPQQPFKNAKGGYTNLYREIYAHYAN